MTNLFNSLWRETSSTFIGFDALFNAMVGAKLDQHSGYPFYRISKTGNNKYSIELAVAGFGKQDIDVELNGDVLSISGAAKDRGDESTFIYNGLSQRSFTRKFVISNTMVVHGASLANGILKIMLEQLSDDKKSRKIEIEDEASTVTEFAANNPVLLTEEDRERANGKLM
jgi:molecular chaperone IbpA